MPDDSSIIDGEVLAKPLRLTFEKVADQRVVPEAVLRNTRVEAWVHEVLGELVVSLCTFMAEDHLTGEWVERQVEFSHTWKQWDSWWQHTKAVHFPTLSRWLRRPPRPALHVHLERRLVRLHHDRYAALPDAPVYPADFGKPIIVERWSKPQTITTYRRTY